MTGYDQKLPIFYLKPAELYISKRPALVTTVLGSCVSVTLFNRRLGIAVICHALLPRCRGKEACHANCAKKYKYVNCVIPEMVKRIRWYGIERREIEVKLFGGADMFGPRIGKDSFQPVGRLNIEAALKAIEAQRLRLNIADVGGLCGRKFRFYTHTGEILLKRINNRNNSPEARYLTG